MATLTVLRHRARLLVAIRRFFEEEGYWEVETPLLSRETCVDAWLDPFCVPCEGEPVRFLQTSPEFAMKRLLVAGAEAIFQITRSFRAGEIGPRHNPEFTLLEWYRAKDTHHEQMDCVERLVRQIAELPLPADPVGSATQELGKPRPVLPSVIPRLTYDQAFQRYAGASVLGLAPGELVDLAESQRLSVPPSLRDDRDGLLNLLLAELVEPQLKELGAVFLTNFPASQAALARMAPSQPTQEYPTAERFELYLEGIELCNGYHELTDAAELRERFVGQNRLRVAAGKRAFPVESLLLKAMERGLPPCSGVALGFDRLVMWHLGMQELKEVLAFPWERA